MGRREEREALQSTWHVYEALEPGKPFNRRDLDDADTRAEAAAAAVRAVPPGAQPARDGGYSVSRRTYLPALAAVARPK